MNKRIEFLKAALTHFGNIPKKQIPTKVQVAGLGLDEFKMTEIPRDSVFDELRCVAVQTYPAYNFKAECFFVLENVDLDQEDCHKIGCASHGGTMTCLQVVERIENRIRELS